MSHRQLRRDPVVAYCGVSSQQDRELHLAVVAFSQCIQPRLRLGQSEVADARLGSGNVFQQNYPPHTLTTLRQP